MINSFGYTCSKKHLNQSKKDLQCKEVGKVSAIETLLPSVHEGTLDLIFSKKIRCPYGVQGAWWGKTPFSVAF